MHDAIAIQNEQARNLNRETEAENTATKESGSKGTDLLQPKSKAEGMASSTLSGNHIAMAPMASPEAIQMSPKPAVQLKEPDRDDEEATEEELSGDAPASVLQMMMGSGDDEEEKPTGHNRIQAKLQIGQPNDKYEQEADAIAEKVVSSNSLQRSEEQMNGNDIGEEELVMQPKLQLKSNGLSDEEDPELQRKCAECEEEERLQAKPDEEQPVLQAKNQGLSDEDDPELQRKCAECEKEEQLQTKSDSPNFASDDIQSKISQSKGNGQSLAPVLQQELGTKMGADFSGINVHLGGPSVQMTKELNAKAFTVGNDIHFGQGQYQPHTQEGKKLLAHELTHTIQQNAAPKETIQRKPTGNPTLISPYFLMYDYFREMYADDSIVLKKGAKGTNVIILQEALEKLKYPLPEHGADGKFGKETKAALESFQRDVGFEGKEVDGKFGHKTLGELDRRMASANMDNMFRHHESGGSHLAFKVSVTEIIPKDEDLYLTLMQIFKITRDEAQKLIDEGWHWSNHEEISEADVARGFRWVGVPKDHYESVKGKIVRHRKKRGAQSHEEVEKNVKEDLYKLQGTKKLYKLYMRLEHLEDAVLAAQLGTIGGLAGNPLLLAKTYKLPKLQQEKAEVEAQLNAELAKLGISLAEFKKNAKNFISSFQQFAALTAIRMLDKNQTATNIALTQLNNISNIQSIKKTIGTLSKLYDQASTQWWKGVSSEMTKGSLLGEQPDLITDEASLATYIAAKSALSLGITNSADAYKLFAIYQYSDGKKGFLNSYFQKAQTLQNKAHGILNTNAQQFSILAYPDLDLKKKGSDYAKMSDAKLQATLKAFISDPKTGVLKQISKVKSAIANDTSKIWELKPVWTQAMSQLGLTKEDPQYQLILTEVKRRKDNKFWRDILLAVGGIALGLLALASGPVGWAALAGSIVVGSIDAYIQYQEISFLRSAKRTALDPKDALSDVDPSWVWFYLSLAGIGLDFLDVVKVIRVAKTAKNAKALFDTTVADLTAEAARLKGLGKLEEATKIEGLLTKLAGNEDVFKDNLKILLKLQDNPASMARLAESMADKKVAEALRQLAKHLPDDSTFQAALKFYSGIGNDMASELPELVTILKNGNLRTNKELVENIFNQPHLQKVLLDHPHDPKLLAREWDAWVAGGRVGTFVSFLKKAGYNTDLTKGKSLVDEFGKGFSELSNLAKNRQLLRQTEPKLLDALDAGKLPPEIESILKSHLGDEIIGVTDDMARAKKRLFDSIGPLIGGYLKTNGQYIEMAKILKDPYLLKKVFEGAAHLPGKAKYMEILSKAIAKHNPSPDVLQDLLRIGVIKDPATLDNLITNAGLRKALANNPDVVKALKHCASPCFPEALTLPQIEKLSGLLSSAGLSRKEFYRLNEYIYLHRAYIKANGFDSFFNHLAANLDNIKSGNVEKIADKLIDEGLLVKLGARISDVEAGAIATAIKGKFPGKLTGIRSRTLQDIIKNGIPQELVENIIQTALTAGKSTDEIKDLLSTVKTASGVAYRGEMNQIGKLIYALGDATKAAKAEEFLAMMKAYSGPQLQKRHAQMFDDILAHFSLDEISTLKAAAPSNVKPEFYLHALGYFKGMVPAKLTENNIVVLAKKLESTSSSLGRSHLQELRRVLSDSTFSSNADNLKYIQSKLLNADQNVREFIETEIKGKDIQREIIPLIKSKGPDVTLLEALAIRFGLGHDHAKALTFFNSLSEAQKRLAILHNTEPKLALMLEQAMFPNATVKIINQTGGAAGTGVTISKTLADDIKAALEAIPVGNPSTVKMDTVRGKIVKKINEKLGKELDIANVRALDNVLSEQGSRGSIFEHWVRKHFSSQIRSLLDKAPPFKGVKGTANKAKNVQLDSFFEVGSGQTLSIVGIEMKNVSDVLTGEPLQQLLRYKELVTNPSAYKSGGKTYAKIEIRYVFSSKTVAELNEALIQSHLGSNAVIYYVDAAGAIKKL